MLYISIKITSKSINIFKLLIINSLNNITATDSQILSSWSSTSSNTQDAWTKGLQDMWPSLHSITLRLSSSTAISWPWQLTTWLPKAYQKAYVCHARSTHSAVSMAAWITNKNAAHTELVQVFETQTHTSFTDYEDENGLIFLPIIIQ